MNSITIVGSVNEGNEYLFISDTFRINHKPILYIARNDKASLPIAELQKCIVGKNIIMKNNLLSIYFL